MSKTPNAFSLRLTMGNAAMQDTYDIAAQLRRAADFIEDYAGPDHAAGPLIDQNGNRVGQWSIDYSRPTTTADDMAALRERFGECVAWENLQPETVRALLDN